jgi:hypothetical protein
MKERIDALQASESTIQTLQGEVERLKKELDSKKQSAPSEESKATPSNDFSSATPDRGENVISDPGEILLSPRSEADCQAFLVSQMRLNDDLAAQLATLERRRLLILVSPFFRFPYLAITTNNTP